MVSSHLRRIFQPSATVAGSSAPLTVAQKGMNMTWIAD
jgi:hypothetical protein